MPFPRHLRTVLRIAGLIPVAALTVGGLALHESSRGEGPPARHTVPADDNAGVFSAASPGGRPILLVTSGGEARSFGAYLGEILRTEGLNLFDVAPAGSSLTAETLAPYDTVILAGGPLDARLVATLDRYVVEGGRIVCLRPDPQLAPMLGIARVPGTADGGYLRTAAGEPAAEGIATAPLRFYGTADRYRLDGARAVAWISARPDGAEPETRDPGVTVHRRGRGEAAMWAFDLARSIALQRQGNPALANQDLDGLEGVRTVDLFHEWIDLDRIEVPQADEHQRLLANVLAGPSGVARPLPRLWYFPGRARGLLVATGDAHVSAASAIDEVLALVERYGGRYTVYYSPLLTSAWGRTARRARSLLCDRAPVVGTRLASRFSAPTPAAVARWRARGHEFTLHPWVDNGLEEGWRRYWIEFTGRGFGPVSPTIRTHCVHWTGWVESARVQAAYGIGMNLDYYHLGPLLRTPDGRWAFGHLTGSGLPMKFVDERGQVLDIYQQNTHLADEHLLALDAPGWRPLEGLTVDRAIAVSRAVLGRSVEPGGYAAIGAQFHVDPFEAGGECAARARAWMTATLETAATLGMPIWPADEWLRFTEARHAARFDDVRWRAGDRVLSASLRAPAEAQGGLTVMVPVRHAGHELSAVEMDGEPASFFERPVGGITYALVTTGAGQHRIVARYR